MSKIKNIDNWLDSHLEIEIIGFNTKKKNSIKKEIKKQIITDLKKRG
tara:strand:+ start:99 stop:239 length:141 start_codon:yes stop_codon:yes gene_type:complete